MMPTTLTPAAELTSEQRRHGERELPSISVAFVERNAPDCLPLARHYMKRREEALRYCPVRGEGYVFEPGRWAKAVNALGALLENMPPDLVPEDRRP